MAEAEDVGQEKDEAQKDSTPAGRRKVLEEAAILSDAFDEDILSEIEQRLEQVEGELAERRPEDKVELDKDDLAIDGLPASEDQEAPPTEVELSDEEGPRLDEPQPQLPPELRELPPRRRGLVVGVVAGVVAVLVGIGVWGLWPSEKPQPRPEPELATSYSGRVPNPELMLRVDLAPFMIPLLISPEGSLLRAKISLVAVDPEARAKITKRPVVVRDAIYHALANRPADELKQAKMRGVLSREIKDALNQRLGKKLVGRVYFTYFHIVG